MDDLGPGHPDALPGHQVPIAGDGVAQDHGGDVGREHLLQAFERPPGGTVEIEWRRLARRGPVQIEQQVVDLGQVLGMGGETLSGLAGVIDDDAAEPPHHPHQDDLDGELDARAGHAPVVDEDHARQHHRQSRREPTTRTRSVCRRRNRRWRWPPPGRRGTGSARSPSLRSRPRSGRPRGRAPPTPASPSGRSGWARGSATACRGPARSPPGSRAGPSSRSHPGATASESVPQRRATSSGANRATTSGVAGRGRRHSGQARHARTRRIHAPLGE